MKAVVLFSGGVDSTTCLVKAIKKYGEKEVLALSIYYGQKHDKEIEVSKNLASYLKVKHQILDLKEIFEKSNCSLLKQSNIEIPLGSYKSLKDKEDVISTYVPYRNGLFLSVAASLALSLDASVIYYGIHKDDSAIAAYPDTSIEFNKAISKAIYIGSGKKVKVLAPFANKDKKEVVKQGLKLKVPFSLTWSCYEGKDKACGLCGTCIDRQKAFLENGVIDPIEYEKRLTLEEIEEKENEK